MPELIKLIWDIRSADAKPMAEHHVRHLKEYMAMENLEMLDSGVREINDTHCAAYLVIKKENMIQVRDALKPHRGELA